MTITLFYTNIAITFEQSGLARIYEWYVLLEVRRSLQFGDDEPSGRQSISVAGRLWEERRRIVRRSSTTIDRAVVYLRLRRRRRLDVAAPPLVSDVLRRPFYCCNHIPAWQQKTTPGN